MMPVTQPERPERRGHSKDRLALIRTALQTWAPEHAPHLREHLYNAKFKLINWQNELPEPASAREDEAV